MMIEQIAKLCHEVNRAYCQSLGDYSQPTWDEAPEWQKKSAIEGVRFYFRHIGLDITPEQVHINWMKQKEAEGWVYGEVKDLEKKTHPCMVPYDQLPQEQKSKDYIFKAICDFFIKEV